MIEGNELCQWTVLLNLTNEQRSNLHYCMQVEYNIINELNAWMHICACRGHLLCHNLFSSCSWHKMVLVDRLKCFCISSINLCFVFDYCNRRNFRTQFNFVHFVLLAVSTKISSIRKPFTYTSVRDTALEVQKCIAYESLRTLKYEIFTRTKISAITVIVAAILHRLRRKTSDACKQRVRRLKHAVVLCLWRKSEARWNLVWRSCATFKRTFPGIV